VLKFFLYLSKREQARRFLKRIEEDRKNWKFSAADIREREYWKEYQSAYEEMIQKTSQTCAPWYIAPADHKWFAHLVVASAVIDELRRLDPQFPEVNKKEKRELAKAQQLLH
jgi:polyphosphate kinase 2 (PPK2 family)